MLSRYLRTFKRELLPSTLSFILWAVIIGGIFTFIRSFTANADPTTTNMVIAYASLFLLVLVVGFAAWVFPLLSRFTFNFVDLNFTAFRLAIANLPRTIALGICTSLIIWVCLQFLFPLMFAPGIYGLISTYILEPVFKTYEDMQKAQNETDDI